jgi:beta-xylosidase
MQSGGGTGGGGNGGMSRTDGNTSTGGTTGSSGTSGGTTSATGGNADRTGGTGGTSAISSDPTIGTIKNPVIKGYWADPQVAFWGGKFYIYPTTDGIANWGATVFHAFSSTDLASWKDEGIILDLATISWGKTNAWAPGITVKNGTYYFYFCDAKQIGVATSTSPTGPFKDVLGKPLVTTGQYGGQSIDPYVFDDDDGRSYLFFGNGNANGAELNADMTSFKTAPKTIALNAFREGSVVFKRNGKYYFMYSVSGTDYPDYHVSYATSSSPLGPYADGATILQSNNSLGIQSTGHNSVLALPSGAYYIVYHRWAIPGGDGNHREVCIDKMTFNADGSIAPVVPTL